MAPDTRGRNLEKRRAWEKQYRERNRERINEWTREWRARRVEHDANYHRQKTYGISAEQYEEMINRQGGVCALCLKEAKLVVDHDHVTKRIRGLLCRNCNTALGKLGDDVAGLEKAIAYLED